MTIGRWSLIVHGSFFYFSYPTPSKAAKPPKPIPYRKQVPKKPGNILLAQVYLVAVLLQVMMLMMLLMMMMIRSISIAMVAIMISLCC